MLTSILDIESINPNGREPKDGLEAMQIKELVPLIIELRGLITVPIVCQLRHDNYILISGHTEYWAYRQACEIDPSLPDRMSVFIASDVSLRNILSYLKVVRGTHEVLKSKPKS